MTTTKATMSTLAIALMFTLMAAVASQNDPKPSKDVCPLTASNIFETQGTSQVVAYSLAMTNSKTNKPGEEICKYIGKSDGKGETCCNRPELESLRTRWRTTKWGIYSNRVAGWSRMIKRILESGNKYLEHIDALSKLKAVKLDCLEASREVKVYFEKSNSKNKPEINTIWKAWQDQARKCFLFTFKVKVGLFCAICSKSAYNNIFRANNKIGISMNHCESFLNSCAGFIKQEMIVAEFISAVAALSKCDTKGWTSFEQKYLYDPLNKTKETYLNNFIDKKLTNDEQKTNEMKILCAQDYTMSTMLASDMRVQGDQKEAHWMRLVKDAKSIMSHYSIDQNATTELIYQADDQTSTNQDLTNYEIEFFGASEDLEQYFEGSLFDNVSQISINKLTERSGLLACLPMLMAFIAAVFN